MARKEITTPLDLKNMNNHNQNYEELYNDIRTTDKRLSENMWEEIKGANTMKMLEPVQTADQLPATAEDKSLITVIDEQRVYAYVNDEWQPFSEIDLDPFEPFKNELAEIVSTYESKIQNITQEVQNTKDSAVDSIQSTQSQSESNINQTEQSAVNSINKAQQEAESQIQAIKDEMSTQASELTALFNDSMEQLTSKQDTALAEVDSAKQEAITALENFQNTDTSEWQKYKLSNDDGTIPFLNVEKDLDAYHALAPGNYYTAEAPIENVGQTSAAGFTTVVERSDSTVKHILFRPYNSNQVFVKRYYNEWNDWEPITGSLVTLYDGNISGVGSTFSLNDDPSKYEYLVIYGTNGDGSYISPAYIDSNGTFFVKDMSIFAGADGAMMYEMECQQGASPTEYTIYNSLFYRIHTNESGESATASIKKIVGVK